MNNVFEEIGFEDWEERTAKCLLSYSIYKICKEKRISAARLKKTLGIDFKLAKILHTYDTFYKVSNKPTIEDLERFKRILEDE